MTSRTETVADLVERLTRMSDNYQRATRSRNRLMDEAASTLTSLEAERDRLREALTTIASATAPALVHGHYLAHRGCVLVARKALSRTPPTASQVPGRVNKSTPTLSGEGEP